MSIVTEINGDFSKIVSYLEKYDQYIVDAEPLFQLVGRKLEEVNRTLPGHLSRYKQLFDEIKSLEDFLSNVYLTRIVSRHFKAYNEKYPRALSTKDITIYIDNEEDVVTTKEIIIEVKIIKDKLQSIVEALEQLGWSLKNIVELRINEMQDAIL